MAIDKKITFDYAAMKKQALAQHYITTSPEELSCPACACGVPLRQVRRVDTKEAQVKRQCINAVIQGGYSMLDSFSCPINAIHSTGCTPCSNNETICCVQCNKAMECTQQQNTCIFVIDWIQRELLV